MNSNWVFLRLFHARGYILSIPFVRALQRKTFPNILSSESVRNFFLFGNLFEKKNIFFSNKLSNKFFFRTTVFPPRTFFRNKYRFSNKTVLEQGSRELKGLHASYNISTMPGRTSWLLCETKRNKTNQTGLRAVDMVIRHNKQKSRQDSAGTKAILKPKTNLETTTLHYLLQHECK